ncbi:MAG: TNT domain-containing protein, partial [Haloechinothrix sp.]
MGIELPAELADVAARTGLAWPQADEDAMREQATAWRDAATEIGALASDADSAASGALEAMAGEAGDAASSMWATFVDPDNGSLTGAARGAQQSADRLEHAAEQVASAKVEMVRQLVDAAKNSDAAHAAADGGHPTALLALDTLLGGTATNLASVTGSLVGAVGDTGRAVDAPDLVNAHPGAHTAHGQSGLIGAVTGLGEDIVASVGATAREAPDVAGVLEPPQEAARDMAGSVSEAGGHTPDVVPEPVRAVAAPMVDAAAEPVPEVSPDAPTPPAGIPVGSTGGAGPSFADAPTPRSGIPVAGQYVPPADYNAGRTSLSGFADASPVGPGMSPAPAAPMPAAGPLPSAGPLPP